MFGRRQHAAPDAFGTEVLGYLEPLFATAMRLTRNRADAEDLVQDTLVRALRFQDRFEPGTNLRAWLYTILHNTWRNRLRDTAREAVDVDSERIEELAATADGPAELETPERMLLRATMDADLQAGARRAARRVSPGGLAARRRGILVCGDRRDARRAHRYGNVAHLARPAAVVREAAQSKVEGQRTAVKGHDAKVPVSR